MYDGHRAPQAELCLRFARGAARCSATSSSPRH
jgi:hypothetical protein